MKTLVAALLLGTALCATPMAALAQDTAAPAAAATADSVVATVNGEVITEADIAFAAEDLQQQLQQVPQAEQKAFLVNVLIETKIIAKAAREQQMADDSLFKQRLEYLEERELRRAYFSASVAKPVAPADIQKSYDEYLATLTDGEIHARHILVATEDEAKAVKAELDAGKDFAELAKEKTTDPSGKESGGDLGWFGRGMMVKPFEDAAFSMEIGAVSGPVKSDFGWHIIKVEEKRAVTPPTLEQVTPQITQHLQFQTYEAGVTALRKGATIEIPDAALGDQVNKQAPQ